MEKGKKRIKRNLKSMRSWEVLSVLTLAKIIPAMSHDILICNMKAAGGWTDGFIFRSVTRAEKTKLALERKAGCCSGNKTSPSLPRWEVLYYSVRLWSTYRILLWKQGWADQRAQPAAQCYPFPCRSWSVR